MRYAKTEQGHQVIKVRSVSLSPRQRTMLLLCDGLRPIGDILATVGTSSQADVDALLAQGLIRAVAPDPAPANTAPPPRPPAPSPAPTSAERTAQPAAHTEAESYREAYQLATQFTSELGLKGFRLQLALESAMTLQDLNALLPRLSDAMKSAHGAPKAADKLAQLRRALGTG